MTEPTGFNEGGIGPGFGQLLALFPDNVVVVLVVNNQRGSRQMHRDIIQCHPIPDVLAKINFNPLHQCAMCGHGYAQYVFKSFH